MRPGITLFAAGVLLLAGCAPNNSASSNTTSPAAPATVKAVSNPQLGQILTDGQGRTVYAFTQDEKNESYCTGNCTSNWPPLKASAPTAGDGARSGLLGTLTRDDGSMQVSYNGMPLYYFSKDSGAGETNGQGVGGNWFVVSATGDMVKAQVSPSASPSTGTGGGAGAAPGY